jgi:deoxyhypusine synthase
LIKCLGPTFITPKGEFNLDGAGLRRRGLNRIGNLLVPNDNYCKFEDWVVPILDQMVAEQEGEQKIRWTPSRVIERLGKEIDDESSILYWAQKVRRGPSSEQATNT